MAGIYPLYRVVSPPGVWRWPSVGSGGGSSSTTTTPSGVRRGKGKREFIVSLKDVENRESTVEFLKSQLKLRHLPESPFVEVDDGKKAAKSLAAQKKREARMRAEAQKMALEFAENEANIASKIVLEAEETRKKKLKVYNDSVLALLMIAAKEID